MSHTSQQAPESDVSPEPPKGLFAYRGFMLLWAGQTVSMLGSNVSTVVVPLIAVVTLRATAFDVGLLNFVQTVPFLILSLFIGVLVDRVSRRRLLVTADFGRAIAMGAIPVLAAFGVLNMTILYVCVLVAGVLTVVFDLSYFAHTPSLLPQDLLLTGNSRLELSRQVTALAGPGLAGALIAVVTIPFVVALDAASYVVSVISLLMIRTREADPEPQPKPTPRHVFREIGLGIRALFGNRYLRPVLLNAAAFNLFSQVILTLFVLYATRDLGIAPGWIGLIFASGALGGVVGSSLVRRAVGRFRFGTVFLLSMIIVRASLPFVGLVGGSHAVKIGLFCVIWFATLFGLVTSNACVTTLRQVVVPSEKRGRVNGAYRSISYGVIPLGALLAGVLASVTGVGDAIAIAGACLPFSLLFVIFSPVMRLKKVGEAAEYSV
jgi:MFS family permease